MTNWGTLRIILIVCFSLSLHSISFSQINAVNDGPWNSPGTWESGNIPGTGDNAVIDGFVVDITNTTVTVNNLTIANESGVNTGLNVNGLVGATLTVEGSLVVSQGDHNANIAINISEKGIVDVSMVTSITKGGSATDATTVVLNIIDDGQLQTGSFIYDYHNSSVAETATDVVISNNGLLHVLGDAAFYTRGGNGLQVILDPGGNIDIDGKMDAELFGGQEVFIAAGTGATISVAGETQLKNGVTMGQVKLAAVGGNINLQKSLEMISFDQNGDVKVEISGSESKLDIDENLVFDFLTELSGRIDVTMGAGISLGGDIKKLGSKHGAIEMDNQSFFMLDGTSASQSIPGDKSPGSVKDSINITNIILNKPAGTDLIVSDNLTLKNNLDLQSGVLKMAVSKSITLIDGVEITGGNNNSYVDGEIVKKGTFSGSEFVFPVGDQGRYAPLEISQNLDTEATFSVEYFSCPPPFGGAVQDGIHTFSNNEFWRFESSVPSGQQVDVSLHWTDAVTSGIQNPDSLIIVYENVSENEVQSLGQGALAGANTLTDSEGAVTNDFSCPPPFGSIDMTFGSKDASNPLPVDLNYFKGNLQVNKIFLQWETESEVNFERFEIQKSEDARSFTKLMDVAARSGTGKNLYQTCDEQPNFGPNYYRLKMIDVDGMFRFSETLVINFEKVDDWKVFPNPVHDEFSIIGTKSEEQIQDVAIYNQAGQLVYSGNINSFNFGGMINAESVNASLPGMYFMYVKVNGKDKVLKFYTAE